MKSVDFVEHCHEVGGWVNWEHTTDVILHGDPEIEVTGIAVTWLTADIILASDDGTHTTYCGLWSFDLGVPVITVCHSTCELPGMMALAKYVEARYPGYPVTYLPCGLPGSRVMAAT